MAVHNHFHLLCPPVCSPWIGVLGRRSTDGWVIHTPITPTCTTCPCWPWFSCGGEDTSRWVLLEGARFRIAKVTKSRLCGQKSCFVLCWDAWLPTVLSVVRCCAGIWGGRVTGLAQVVLRSPLGHCEIWLLPCHCLRLRVTAMFGKVRGLIFVQPNRPVHTPMEDRSWWVRDTLQHIVYITSW